MALFGVLMALSLGENTKKTRAFLPRGDDNLPNKLWGLDCKNGNRFQLPVTKTNRFSLSSEAVEHSSIILPSESVAPGVR